MKNRKKYLIILIVVLSLFGMYFLSQGLLLNSIKHQDARLKEEKYLKSVAKERVMDTINLTLSYMDDTTSLNYLKSSYQDDLEYDKLNKEQRVLYDSMLENVLEFKKIKYLKSEVGPDTLDNVLISFGALKRDYPELEIYFTIKEIFEGDETLGLESIYFMPYDSYSKETLDIVKLKEELEIFKEETNLIISNMPSNLSVYDKYRYLATYISLRTTYDYDLENGNQVSNIYGAINTGASICEGYAKAFKYLCKKANLWCSLVEGITNEEAHMWNLVKLDNEYYHIDITWADSSNQEPNSSLWLKYFMVDENTILKDHVITNM